MFAQTELYIQQKMDKTHTKSRKFCCEIQIKLNKIKVEKSVYFLLTEIHHLRQRTWKDVMTSIKCEMCVV